ncbi:MAG TPA: flavoprotein [Tepidisphaeraceae bacterium]|jgi:phosphopantothenoylcysteine decarboxylase/phosphopantothenate--cysteine ligase
MSDGELALKGREIVVAVCGGIAAYKVADLVSKLVQAGAGVTVCMTADATRFVTPLTFEALSRRKVHIGVYEAVDPNDTQHIGLTERADLMVVAPATANVIAKVAHGICDELVSLMINASACPVVFVPSMNNRMWENPITKENVSKLQRLGYPFVGPEEGWLACRNVGKGRMAEVETVLGEVIRLVGLGEGKAPEIV